MSNPLPGTADGLFSAHDDVMRAEPTDEQSKRNLVEEIKNRAKSMIGGKQYEAAELLYGKAIKVLPEAVLYSNRALARLSLNKHAEALEDCNAALELDEKCFKAYYRKGQACLKLQRPVEAVRALEAGLKEAPSKEEKIFKDLLSKAVKAADVAARKGKADTPPSPPTTTNGSSSSSSTKSPSASPKPSPLVVKKKGDGDKDGSDKMDKMMEEMDIDSDDEVEGGSLKGVRGYKKKEDGSVTTYFHKELSEKEKELIGDIAPKRIEPTAAPAAAAVAKKKGSAWNQAGTWEERDTTQICTDMLKKVLVEVEAEAPWEGEGEKKGEMVKIKIVALSYFKGDAQINYSRGKRRALFDFTFQLDWKARSPGGTLTGHFKYLDMSYDCNGDYEIEIKVDPHRKEAKPFIDKNITSPTGALRKELQKTFDKFVADFNALPY